MNSPSHSGQHADENDIAEALEAKVGIDSSAVVTSHDYILTQLKLGWTYANEAWAYASATTITVPAGAASKYQKGDKIKWTQTSVKYAYIITVADTLLTVVGDAVTNAVISLNYYSHQENPMGFPHWFAYTPTGPTNTNLFGRFSIDGRTVSCKISGVLTGTPNWTNMPILPVTASANMAGGVEGQTSYEPCGVGGLFDTGTANRLNSIAPVVTASATICALKDSDSAGNQGAVTTTAPITWVSGDEWWVWFTYEI